MKTEQRNAAAFWKMALGMAVCASLSAACATKSVPDPELVACQQDLYSEDCSDDRRKLICEYRQAHPDEVSAYGFTLEECARFFGLEDAGSDGAPSADDGGDAGVASECTQDSDCAADEPRCDAGECVACTENANCAGRADLPVCDATSGDCVACSASELGACGVDEVCRESGRECVQCNVNAECASNSASRCDGNSCVACVEDADCQHLANKVCDSGQCVQCSPATELVACPDGDSAPGDQGLACDPVALTCTGERRGSLGTCGRPVTSGDARIVRCVSDSECSTGHRCVPTTFKGEEHGNYCLLMAQNDACSAPWPRPLNATSVGGLSGRYCFPREQLATCEAVVEFGSSCVVDGECGRDGVADGHCEGGRCTYGCSGDADCNGTTCTGFASGQFCNPF